MDPFSQEVANLHAVRRAIRELDDAGREAFIRRLIETGSGAPDDWVLSACDAQLPPLGDWSVWLFLGAGAAARRMRCPAPFTLPRAPASAASITSDQQQVISTTSASSVRPAS
jgi:phage terminase large subunit-like protein